MKSLIKTGLCSLVLGGAAVASADDPCWNLGFSTPGQLCFMMDEQYSNKTLIGKVVLSSADRKNVCQHEHPTNETSIKSAKFASLLGDYTGLQKVVPDIDPQPVSQFINRFNYCHPDSDKAKENPLNDLLKVKKQDLICFNPIQDEGDHGVDFGLWDNEKSSCDSLNITYMKDGVREVSQMKKDANIVQACHWVVLTKPGWAQDGPKGEKGNWRTSARNPRQAMLDCMKQAGEKYRYCSFDLEGYYYTGINVDWNDTEGGANSVLERMCFKVVSDK